MGGWHDDVLFKSTSVLLFTGYLQYFRDDVVDTNNNDDDEEFSRYIVGRGAWLL